MEYMTIKEAAVKWHISIRRMQEICALGKIDGAIKFGNAWAIPRSAQKPTDSRIKTGKYIKS